MARCMVTSPRRSAVGAAALLVAAPADEPTAGRAAPSMSLDWSSYRAAQAWSTAAAVPAGRLEGADRFATATEIAQRSFPDGAEVAYLARADQFADALAAGTLTDGPILLVPSCGDVPPPVAEEVSRLDPQTVTALGGTQAVCENLLATVAGDRAADRLAADDRFGTAAAIANAAHPDGAATVYLANAAGSPDAVAGGALTDGPILLVPSDGAPPAATTDTLGTLDPGRVVALGGTTAIDDATLAQAADGQPTARLAGPDRFATAAAITQEQFGDAPPVVYLARADVFADAVASGSLTDGPVLLVPSCGDLPAAVTAYLSSAATSQVIALGGQTAVCDALLDAAAQLPASGDGDPGPEPTPGPTPTPGPDPTPGPTPGPDPDTEGTVYASEFLGDYVAVDMDDLTQVPTTTFATPADLNTREVHGALPAREFVYATSDFNVDLRQNTFEVVMRNLDTSEITAQFPWRDDTSEDGPFIPHCLGPVEPSLDAQWVIARSWYDQTCTDLEYIDVMNRDGEFLFSYPGEFLTDWAWTPNGDLLVTVTKESGIVEEGAVLAVTDGEEFARGEGRLQVLATFPGGDETPVQLALSDDGSQIAYSFVRERAGELYVMPFEADAPSQFIARHSKSLQWTEFSPDNDELLVGVFEYREPVKGNNSTIRIPNHRDPEPIAIPPDGGEYAFQVPEIEGGQPERFDVQGPFLWDPR